MSELSIISGTLLLIISTILRYIALRENNLELTIKNFITNPLIQSQNSRQAINNFVAQCIGLMWLIFGISISNLPSRLISTRIGNLLDLLSFYTPLIVGVVLLRVIKNK